jgi:N utilization substance protein B
MLNRRLIRVKVFQSLYSFWQDEQADRLHYEKQLRANLMKLYEVYLFLLALPLDLKHIAELEIELEQSKYFPNDNEIGLDRNMAENTFISLLEQHQGFTEAQNKLKLKWSTHRDLLRNLYVELKKDDTVKEMLATVEKKLSSDRKTIQSLLNRLASDTEAFNHLMEEVYISWPDDKTLIMNELNKSMRLLKDSTSDFISSAERESDELFQFSKELFGRCLVYDKELSALIAEKTKNWDIERIALTDIILMKMAVCEMMHFPSVPVKVSINEYLEIAKIYSTPNSKNFINGVLDALQKELREQGKIHKEGRGLLE